MDALWIPLAVAFFIIALVYASVGFGGGSSYTALLAMAGVSTLWIPTLSLSCNLIVVSGGCWHFARKGHLDHRLILPFLLTSMPAAFLAGRIPIETQSYLLLLAISLFAVAVLLFLRPQDSDKVRRVCPVPIRLIIGGALGGLSGLVGIGGGIFLAPILLLTGWASPKQSAAAASVFIFVNSFAGLAGQLTKEGSAESLSILPLLGLAVLAGGQIGSRWGAGRLPSFRVRQTTAVLIVLVAARLWMQQL